LVSLADQEMRSNRNGIAIHEEQVASLADQEMRSNRNWRQVGLELA
tara:strand:- start:116 stop:253 length:138 start_codon:yes stop_codon:yes gene_type:complete